LSGKLVPLPEITRIKKIYSAFFQQEFPADLTLVVVWLAASSLAIFLPGLNATPLKYVLIIPVLLFISGYGILAALFPKNDDIGLSERIALSFGLSIALAGLLVALIGFGSNFTQGKIQLDLIAVISILVADAMMFIAFFRRSFLLPDQRFRMPFARIGNTIRGGLVPDNSDRIDTLLSIILVFVIIIALATTIYVIASPKESEHFSEFYLLGEKHMAADYPDQIIPGISYPMYIGVGNHEYRNMTYTIETWTALTEFNNLTNSTTILAMDPNNPMSITLGHNETMIVPYNLSIQKAGYNRIEFLLFNETMPGPDVTGSDRINASYRDLYLRVTVI
jgi:uncharacterized membrane protein